MPRVVAEIGLHEPEKTLARGSGHSEQKKRECDLSANHGAVGTPGVRTAHHAAHTALHQAGDVRPRELQGRPEAKDDGGGDGQTDAEEKDRHVHFDDGFGGEGILRKEFGEQGKTHPCQERADHSSGGSDGKRLGKQLPDDAEAIGSYGGAHGQLMLAFGSAGQEQDGYVPAADQEQGCNGAEQEIEGWSKRLRVHVDNTAQADAEFFRITRWGLFRELFQ